MKKTFSVLSVLKRLLLIISNDIQYSVPRKMKSVYTWDL